MLFHLEQAWKKKESSSCLTIGSYDGAELCELIEIFTLLVLQDIINVEVMGLYRNDGLLVHNKVTTRKTDKKKRK